MKSKKKRLRVLVPAFLSLLVLCGVLIVVKKKAAEYENAQKVQKDMIIPYTAEKIKSISYTPESGVTIGFVKEKGIWTSTTHPDSELDQTKVGVLASSVTGCGIAHVMNDVTDPSVYGLEPVRIDLVVCDMDGNEIHLLIGDVNDTALQVYCMNENDPKTVYAVSTGLITDLEQTIDDYVKEEEVTDSGASSYVEEAAE